MLDATMPTHRGDATCTMPRWRATRRPTCCFQCAMTPKAVAPASTHSAAFCFVPGRRGAPISAFPSLSQASHADGPGKPMATALVRPNPAAKHPAPRLNSRLTGPFDSSSSRDGANGRPGFPAQLPLSGDRFMRPQPARCSLVV